MGNIVEFWKITTGKYGALSNPEFQELLSPHINPLYNLAYHWCGGNRFDAEDLLQNLLFKLYIKRDTLSSIEHLRPWLVRVLYRMFIDQYRQNRRPFADDSEEVIDQTEIADDQKPDGVFESSQLLDRLSAALMRLPEQQRALVVMYDIENYQQEEISEILEIPLGTVKSRLHRARERLRNILSASGTFSDVDPLS